MIGIGVIAGLAKFVLVLVTLYALYQAYMGEKFIMPVIGEHVNTWIAQLGMAKMFEPQK